MNDAPRTTPAALAAEYRPGQQQGAAHAYAWWEANGPAWYGREAAAALTVERVNREGMQAVCAILTINGLSAWPGDGTGMILNIIRDQAAEIERLRREASAT
jgi:hypothetical protein